MLTRILLDLPKFAHQVCKPRSNNLWIVEIFHLLGGIPLERWHHDGWLSLLWLRL